MRALFELPIFVVDRVITLALEEDLASGDVTTEACVDRDMSARAHAVAREPLIVCGGPVFERVFTRVDPLLVVEAHAAEGAHAPRGA
ncbi:MAG TPA: hypothetical protein VGY54_22755, partial [Polyangiaceae bacterium]|nr:hypothetical protein [Polyangiaceae bacterium]